MTMTTTSTRTAVRRAAVAALTADGVGFDLDTTRLSAAAEHLGVKVAGRTVAEQLVMVATAAFSAATDGRRPTGPVGLYLLAEVAELYAAGLIDHRSVDAHIRTRLADCLATPTPPEFDGLDSFDDYVTAACAQLAVTDPRTDDMADLFAVVTAMLGTLSTTQTA